MTSFQNWSNFHRIDAVAHGNEVTYYGETSRHFIVCCREHLGINKRVSFYCEDQLVMTACRGITLGSLRSLYNAEIGNNYSTLLGVRPKGGLSQMIVSVQEAYLNEDEYELILSDCIPSTVKPGSQELSMPPCSSRNVQNPQSFLIQYQIGVPPNQKHFPQLPLSLYPLPSLPCYQEPIESNIQQQSISLSPPVTSRASVPVVTELPQDSNLQPGTLSLLESGSNFQEIEKNDGAYGSINGPICEENVNAENHAVQEKPPDVEGDISKESENSFIDTGQFPYQCEVCHIPFKSKTKFYYHKRRHTDDNPHLCTYCGEAFKFFHELSKHRDEQHLCNKSFKCEQCSKSFSSRRELERHSWRHTGEKSHKCELCGKEYTSKGNLSLHRQKHTGGKPLKCSLCPKMFNHKTLLENHIRLSHTGERPFICKHCEKAFPTSSQLSSHEKIHSDSKPYKCTECGKGFRHGHILKRHSLIHTNEKPYKCHVCGKAFRELSNLQYHNGTHFEKSQRSVICPLCGKSIVAWRGLRRHLKCHHNKVCASERDAEAFLNTLQPGKNSSEEMSEKQSKTRSEKRLPNKDVNIVGATPPIRGKIFRKNSQPEQSSDMRKNEMSSTSKGIIMNQRRLPSCSEFENTLGRDNLAVSVNANVKESRLTGSRKEAKFHCSICLRMFRGPKTLKNHMKIAHTDHRVLLVRVPSKLSSLKCGMCHLHFDSKSSLNVHIDKVHSCFDMKKLDVTQIIKADINVAEKEASNGKLIEATVVKSIRTDEDIFEQTAEGLVNDNNSGPEEGTRCSEADKEKMEKSTKKLVKDNKPEMEEGDVEMKESVQEKELMAIKKMEKDNELEDNLLFEKQDDQFIRSQVESVQVGKKKPILMRPKFDENLENKKSTSLERNLPFLPADGNLSEASVCNRVAAHHQKEASFQVIYSSVLKEQNEKLNFQNTVENGNYSTEVLNIKSILNLSTRTSCRNGKETNKSALQQITVAESGNSGVEFFEKDRFSNTEGVNECIYKGRRIEVIESDILSKEPPPGYSFAFLPILIANKFVE